jgi:demethylmenaquinone methyltransferase/2-methoxy-6-polyprenyl-1,4-benzoquinol methylase/phosphoethanolamine N-methyltransferase
MGTAEPKQSIYSWTWLCPLASLLMAAGIGYLFGLSWWTTLLIGVMLACPVMAMWSYLFGERPLPVPLGPVPATRGTNFNWIAPWYDGWCSVFGLGKGFRSWTLSLAEFMPGDYVLDVGCGNGVLTHRIADIVGPEGEAWGIDPAPDMIRIAMQRRGRTANAAHFKLAAIEALPFEDGTFDVALISLVLHHLPTDVKLAGLREVHRVLKAGGRLLVVEPDRPDHWLLRAVMWPARFYKRLKAHLDGRTALILQNSGFGPVTVIGRWKHSVTFWRTQKTLTAQQTA